MFCLILVFRVRDMLSSRLVVDIFVLLMILGWLKVVVKFFEVVVGRCRWF